MMESHATFWWLLALVGLFIVIFGIALWVTLSRREGRNRVAEDYIRDIRGPGDSG